MTNINEEEVIQIIDQCRNFMQVSELNEDWIDFLESIGTILRYCGGITAHYILDHPYPILTDEVIDSLTTMRPFIPTLNRILT
jgi:hypothetical protein